ncbi:UPF0755 protein [Rhodovulum imhoffii]|uniref:Endolytic murein transglycosylase n=1 Tax=Rhodovulum imhoffii TaxID=365340 RepID=A0A2T5BVC2_9RHOB|nr:endolytic transglycosylase MltG [Rhodovulum imhoffii]MBK5934224.1 branched-chain alpha-keto acid dehydrogenase subunit E2 [Rhodovulum imhoffii]PTN03529.1 UPF0755 protein [Rhodovulum imhoffii]
MWRAVASTALTVLVVVLFCIAGVVLWGKRQYNGPGPLEAPICLKVERGASMNRLSRQLEAQGAVRSAHIYRLGTEYAGISARLKAGSFLVPAGASMAEIAEIVTRDGRSTCGTEVNFRIGVLNAEVQVREIDPATGQYREVIAFDPSGEVPGAYEDIAASPDTRFRVTLAEGVTSWQVVEELKAAAFLEGEVEQVPDEGGLAPDSYEVRPGVGRAALLDEMQARQVTVLEKAWAARAEGLPLKTPEEALVLASIIEKETGIPEERRRVASVFVNRLRQGMRLQTDPTVIYGITKGQGALGRGLRQSELRRATPWNTYVIEGLPPTPIANPGGASVAAALNPEDTDFLFFVADGTGGHVFAKTLDEHNANVRRWRQIEADRNAN